ncbi:endonuclease/exonuclease/phosphatase domain-containing protein [Planoprotostelium fungivorum]|uniref:Endonuclease/exonuclease/phosphatase domain-containing protein n=1 Tax=Planoprotostelium fungivorum TaxID=1890364 RepID=A0A2P6N216_9EUKA|nr:endonuclease/exonuclease/phosphatase domain-containing protein [Planoprotostelium fungivorum]PRP79442.1 endonuclease/exonuclease/phosphatase domain-containing protein [Planoprotostelium fungivorum]
MIIDFFFNKQRPLGSPPIGDLDLMTQQLSITTLEAYLLKSDPKSSRDQLQRVRRIADFIKTQDVAVLQGVWGSNVTPLQDAVSETHTVPPFCAASTLISFLSYFLNIILFWWCKTGGLWFSYKKSFRQLWYSKHIFSTSIAARSVQAILIDINSQCSGKYLLIFNTQLDEDENVQAKQVQEIHKFISDTVSQLNSARRDGRLPGFDFARTGVLLTGDLAMDAGSPSYIKLKSLFVAKDFYSDVRDKKKEGEQVQKGQTKGKKKTSDEEETERVDTDSYTYDPSTNDLADGQPMRRDYIFGLDNYFGSTWHQQFMKLEATECLIHKTQKSHELSNHHAVTATLSFQ